MAGGRSRDEWIALVKEFQASGLTRQEFSRRKDLNMYTLDWWRAALKTGRPTDRRVRRETADSKATTNAHAVAVTPRPAFLEVEVVAPDPGFVVELASGHRVEVPLGFDAHELRRLVGALC